MKLPNVSVIITTRNEESNLENCLKSIKQQTYQSLEIIVIDNKSTDRTKEIAEKYTKQVFDKGPERSAQRNFGVSKAKGKYVLILDADMILTENVLVACVVTLEKMKVGGIIIPEESFGEGFWAQCKKLERSFYVGNDAIEAARFFDKEKFVKVGGFDESLTGPEDWDLSQRVKEKYGLARIKEYIMHNEGKLSLLKTLKKKFYYSRKLRAYLAKTSNNKYSSKQINIIDRYVIFFSQPQKLIKNPLLSVGMLLMKTSEFITGALGIVLSK